MNTAKPLTDFFKIVIRNDRLQLDPQLPFEYSIDGNSVELVNLSESGVAVKTAHPILITEASEFKIKFDGQIAVAKKIKLIRNMALNENNEYALSFDQEFLPENFVYNLQTSSEIASEINLSQNNSKKLDKEFLSYCMQLKDFLESLKTKCEFFEKSIYIQSLDSKTSAFEMAFKIFGNKAINTIKEFAHGIDASLVKIQDKEIRKMHSDFFKRNVGEYFLSATFTGRAFHKPRGYAGDYEMMNQIYRNAPEGDSLFQKVIHMYGINETSSISVRLRKDYLKKKIKTLMTSTGKIVVGSLACGPAREVIELLAELDQNEISRFTFVLMDQDHHALLNAQRNILKVIRERKLNCEIFLLPLSVKQILEQSEESKALDQLKFDLLYTAGLYDYLPQKVAKNLTTIISKSVKDTGELIIGNFHPDNPTKTISDLVADWRLIHRNHEQMKDLVENTKFKIIDFYLDEVEVDLFLIAKK